MKPHALLIVAILFVFVSGYVRPTIASDATGVSQILIDDMPKPSEGKLHGVPESWDWNSGVVRPPSVAWPTQFGAAQGWGHIYEDVMQSGSTNTRVQIRNLQTWWLSKSTE